jgi:hypothetical protein
MNGCRSWFIGSSADNSRPYHVYDAGSIARGERYRDDESEIWLLDFCSFRVGRTNDQD